MRSAPPATATISVDDGVVVTTRRTGPDAAGEPLPRVRSQPGAAMREAIPTRAINRGAVLSADLSTGPATGQHRPRFREDITDLPSQFTPSHGGRTTISGVLSGLKY